MLIREFCFQTPGSPRFVAALARMNYIHSVYQQSGKIRNSDMLYTLSLFALEPVRWIERYEWRCLTDLELSAIGTFWKQIGTDMKIDMTTLDSATDGLGWLNSIDGWSRRYEELEMVPASTNKITADVTTKLLLWTLPTCLQPLGFRVVSVLLEDRLRSAMM